MGKSQRVKGHSWERDLANIFKANGWPDAKRHLEYQGSDCNGVDLDNTRPFLIQAKAYKKYAPISKISEIQDSTEYSIPVLITKGDRLPPMACLPLADFLQMAQIFRDRLSDVMYTEAKSTD